MVYEVSDALDWNCKHALNSTTAKPQRRGSYTICLEPSMGQPLLVS